MDSGAEDAAEEAAGLRQTERLFPGFCQLADDEREVRVTTGVR